MKPCIKCGSTDRYADGDCRPCGIASCAAWYAANAENDKAKSAAWQKSNPEKRKAITQKYIKAHPEKVCAKNGKRRAAKLNATPLWANAAKIEEFYYTAQMLGMHTGDPYEVDHIVPLISKLVCGLHCEANLQILEQAHNRRKHNRIWPDMPC